MRLKMNKSMFSIIFILTIFGCINSNKPTTIEPDIQMSWAESYMAYQNETDRKKRFQLLQETLGYALTKEDSIVSFRNIFKIACDYDSVEVAASILENWKSTDQSEEFRFWYLYHSSRIWFYRENRDSSLFYLNNARKINLELTNPIIADSLLEENKQTIQRMIE